MILVPENSVPPPITSFHWNPAAVTLEATYDVPVPGYVPATLA